MYLHMDNKKRKSFAHDYFNRATTFIPDLKALKREVGPNRFLSLE